MTNDNHYQWTDPGWLARAEKWIQEALAEQGLKLTGPIERPHVRAWGIVMRVPTDKGDVYFKATTLSLENEAVITEALSGWFPELLPKLFKADIEQNWLLIADGGARLRDAFADGLAVGAWSGVLESYARFQIDLSSQVDSLLSLGSPDRRLARLPELYNGLVDDTEWLLIDQEDGLSTAEYQRLKAGKSYIAHLCQELASFNIPDSLNHGDLHDGNIFYENGRYLFFDWGDSSISHPFFSLRTVFVSMENTFSYEEDDPRFDAYARDYLKVWQAFASEDSLWQAYQLAKRLWSIVSALQWKYTMSYLETLRQEMDFAVPSLLQEVLEANPEM